MVFQPMINYSPNGVWQNGFLGGTSNQLFFWFGFAFQKKNKHVQHQQPHSNPSSKIHFFFRFAIFSVQRNLNSPFTPYTLHTPPPPKKKNITKITWHTKNNNKYRYSLRPQKQHEKQNANYNSLNVLFKKSKPKRREKQVSSCYRYNNPPKKATIQQRTPLPNFSPNRSPSRPLQPALPLRSAWPAPRGRGPRRRAARGAVDEARGARTCETEKWKRSKSVTLEVVWMFWSWG